MKIKIALDAGHGLTTPGKRCLKSIDPNETREWVLNNRVCTAAQELLSQYENVEIIRLDDTTGATDVPLAQRSGKANAWGADWVFSFHHNAGIKGGSGGGIVVFCYIVNNQAERNMRAAIYKECVERGGLTGRATPCNSANFHMVREPKGNAILTEYGFMDSTKDTPVILDPDYSRRMAEGTVAAIAKQLNLIKKPDPEPYDPEDYPMTDKEREEFDQLKTTVAAQQKIIDALKPINVVYHWYSQLPKYARATIEALHKDKVFVGNGPDDMNLTYDMMRMMVIDAHQGLYGEKYKNL